MASRFPPLVSGVPALSAWNPFRVLGDHPNFRLFWMGQTLSLVGTWMQSMAQGWLALELSNSASFVGLVACAGSLPVLVLSLHAGVLVDRVNKLRLVTIAQTLLLFEAGLLAWCVLTHHITPTLLIVLTLINGLASAFEIPARQSLMVELVPRERLHEAIALNSSGFNLARIVGPALGGVVIRYAGLGGCFAVNAVSYLAVLAGLMLIRLPVRPAAAERLAGGRAAAGLMDGIRYVWRTPPVRALVAVITVYSLLGTSYLTLLPVFARDVLGARAEGYGSLLGAVGVGGLTGALALAALGRRVRPGKLLVYALIAFATLLTLFSLARTPFLAEAALLFTGLAMIVTGALSNTILQTAIPDHLRGRVMAFYSLLVVGLPLTGGSLAAGRLAAWVGVPAVVGGGGLAIIVATAVIVQRCPELMEL